jgi:fluoride exporter
MLGVMLRIQFRPCRVHDRARSRSCIAMITANRRQIRQLTYWCDARLPRTSSTLGAPCRFRSKLWARSDVFGTPAGGCSALNRSKGRAWHRCPFGHSRSRIRLCGRDERLFLGRNRQRAWRHGAPLVHLATAWFGAKFPWGTLFINISGSFVIGFFFAISGPNGRFDASTNVKIFVMTGLCGGYTTFSAFSLQTLSLFQQGDWFRGSGYIGASVLLCVVGVWAGYALATAINPASSSGW